MGAQPQGGHGTTATRALVPTLPPALAPGYSLPPVVTSHADSIVELTPRPGASPPELAHPQARRGDSPCYGNIVTFTLPATLYPLGVPPLPRTCALTKRTVLIPILLGLVTSTGPAGMRC